MESAEDVPVFHQGEKKESHCRKIGIPGSTSGDFCFPKMKENRISLLQIALENRKLRKAFVLYFRI